MIPLSLRAAIAVVLIGSLPAAVRVAARSQGHRPLSVSLSPAEPRPGDVMWITVRGVSNRLISGTVFGQSLSFSFDDRRRVWNALAGVDLDTRPGSYRLQILEAEAPSTMRTVSVVPRRFLVRRLRVAEDFVNPPREALDRIESDNRLLKEAYSRNTMRRWKGAFRLPVNGRPTSNFGTRSYYNGQRRAPHAGVDFTSEPGTPVMATNFGTVAIARSMYFTGNTIVIDHGAQLFSVYAHLSESRVNEGDGVTPETVIGLVGATGRVTGPHLHWSVRLNGARVDPLALIAATQVP